MIVPIGTDRDGRHPPRAVTLLIALNVAVYLAMMAGVAKLWTDPSTVDQILTIHREALPDLREPRTIEIYRNLFVEAVAAEPGVTPWWTYFTAMFTHSPASIWHILGNMLFLWAFGKSIESHLGFWRFLILYLAGGFAAWLAHGLVSDAPGIGASGATSSVACLFLAFFPRSQTRVIYLLGMSIQYVPSAWIVGLYFTIDVLRLFLDKTGTVATNVAAGAHLGGAIFGMAAGLLLLRLGWAPRGEWDMLHLIRQFFRRRAMRAALSGAKSSPWMSGQLPERAGVPKNAPPLSEEAASIARLRAQITAGLKDNNIGKACDSYRALLAIRPKESLQPELQLELGNRAMQIGAIGLAADAFSNFLGTFPQHEAADQVRLLLTALYTRHLQRAADALALLNELDGGPATTANPKPTSRLHTDEQRALCAALRAEVMFALQQTPERAR